MRQMIQARMIAVAGGVLLIACATAGRPRSSDVGTGVRFTIGTVETPAPARGALGMFD
jgi:hypothetical protein